MTTLPSRRSAGTLPAQHARFRGSKEDIVGRNGEINAADKKDLSQQLFKMYQMVTAGEISLDHREEKKSEVRSSAIIAERNEILASAYKSTNPRKWAELGAAVSADISEAADREGFMRRILLRVEVANGTLPRVRVKQKNIIALVAASALDNKAVYLRDKYIVPPEYYIKHNIRVEEREIAQGSGDILEDKFYETQEGIMVAEDRKLTSILQQAVGIYNERQILAGGLSPASLSQLRTSVLRWNLPATTLLFASDVLNDIVGQGAGTFGGYFDPVSQFEIVQTGMIGTLLGMKVMTDAYKNPNLKVLNPGDIYVFSNPEMLGAYTDRGPVQSQEVNSYMDGSPARGWNFFELLSTTIMNPRGFVYASRG